MESSEPKKLALIYILNILKSDTDCDHPMYQEELCEALAEIVGECEEERDSVRAILERVEALADELRETLWWLRRTSA